MEEVENKQTSSSESSTRKGEQNPQAETSQENTDDIIAPINIQSSIEASISILGDNTIPEHDETHSPEVTDFPEIESNSTNASADQPIKQDEYLLTDNSTSTSQETEQIHQGAIAAESEPETLEDINNRQRDGGSIATASSDVDNLSTELSTSSSITKELPIEPIGLFF